ncbi:putative integral membrane protein (TIGR00698 family) [Hoeflea marina]|uniref:Putative integral membrane protein (TIGR00698 family) n=1 Tax=Hoeflea marina TaxID=274592 RepID=A0A317PQ17_9HYPH|nr:YeiH family protein [Hoeflea marina]PWW03543.1 putative integral membrane protein (TIGR00698 family) [Hoeflea marina]
MSQFADLVYVRKARVLFPGVLTSLTVAFAAKFISEHYGAPVMLMALLIGMAFNFLVEDGGTCVAGIEFSSKVLLRFGVALLGLGITVQQIASTGSEVLLITLTGVALTIAMGLALSRFLGRGARFGLLIGGAVAICGASAALAISSVLPKSETLERDTIFTVIGVTALSTLAMIVYPIIADLMHLSEVATGVFFGATIHDVAQVVGAGYSVSELAGDTATFVKLLRVALLVPIVVVLSLVFSGSREPGARRSLPIPFFVIGFAALVIAGSYDLVPVEVKDGLLSFSRWCLVVAIAALGMKTSLRKLGDVGGSAIVLICALTGILAVFALTAIKIYMN